MATRQALSDGPPAYARLPLKMYNRDLRPILLITTLFGAIWSIAAGVTYLKDRYDRNNTATLNKYYIVMAILYLFVAVIEVYGLAACYLQRIRLVKAYFFAASLGALTVTSAELFRLIIHFTSKTDIINACIADQMDENDGSFSDLTKAQATSLCNASWSNATAFDVGLLIVTALLSFFFASLAASYLHQLINPNTLRSHRVAPSSAYVYPLHPYPGQQQQQQPYGAEGGFIPPPYAPGGGGGPPTYDPSGYDASKEKSGSGQGGQEGYEHGPEYARADESSETVRLEPRDTRAGVEGRV